MSMEAGRELDALVAEKVMGWKWYTWKPLAEWAWPPPDNCLKDIQDGVRFIADPAHESGPHRPATGDEPIRNHYGWIPPMYSTDIDAAWTVVEKLREAGWLVSVKSMPAEASFIIEGSRSEYDAPMPDKLFGKGRVACEMSWMGDGFRPREWAVTDTAPLAICLAALEAVGFGGERCAID